MLLPLLLSSCFFSFLSVLLSESVQGQSDKPYNNWHFFLLHFSVHQFPVRFMAFLFPDISDLKRPQDISSICHIRCWWSAKPDDHLPLYSYLFYIKHCSRFPADTPVSLLGVQTHWKSFHYRHLLHQCIEFDSWSFPSKNRFHMDTVEILFFVNSPISPNIMCFSIWWPYIILSKSENPAYLHNVKDCSA